MDKSQLAVERENAANELAEANARIAQLEAKLDNKNKELNIATAGDGVSPDLAKEIAWRIKAGLPEKHARAAALAQLAKNVRIASAKEAAKTAPVPAPAPIPAVVLPRTEAVSAPEPILSTPKPAQTAHASKGGK